MSPQRYAEIKQAFANACERHGGDRRAYLERLGAADPDLRREVEELLALDPLDTVPVAGPPAAARLLDGGSSGVPGVTLPASGMPAQVGPYRVVRKLGEGGMGVVYEAEQTQPRRSVALKMIRPGLTSAAHLKRFDFEAEVLGRLQHPGIAQVYEAGRATLPTPHGDVVQPYFAMEYVRGKPLLEHVREAGLDRRARIALLAGVCDAVHHAHQKGVIHRDLKPGNLLVDEQGRPKVLDFGVARVADVDIAHTTVGTGAGQLVGTLPYMSPEQLAGDARALDTRSDVYALGVIACELLTGQLPHDVRDKPITEAMRRIREEEPRRLGSFDRALGGDLELIIATALARDRELRYASAAELAADLRRFLSDQPISARPPSALYQVRKFARRNRGLVAGLAAAAAVLVAGTAVSTWQAVRATRAERRATDALTLADKRLVAERQAQQASAAAAVASAAAAAESAAVSDFLVTIFEHADPAVTQQFDRTLLRLLLDEAAVRIEEDFAGQPSVRARLHGVIGQVYLNLTEFVPAEEHLTRARALRAELDGDNAPETLALELDIGDLRSQQGRHVEAEQIYRAVAGAFAEQLGATSAETLQARYKLAGELLRQQRVAEAEAEHAEVLALLRAAHGDGSQAVMDALNGLGLLRAERGEFVEAVELLRQVHERSVALRGADHPGTLTVMRNLARTTEQLGEFAEAERLTRSCLERTEQSLGPEHYDTIQTRINLGVLLLNQQRLAEAEEVFRSARESARQRFGLTSPVAFKAQSNLCIVLRRLERLDEAAGLFEETLALARTIYGDDDRNTRSLLSNYAGLLFNLGRLDEAVRILRRVIAVDEEIYGPDHVSVLRGRHNLGLLLIDQGRAAEAGEILADVVERTDRVAPPGHPFRFEFRRTYGDALRLAGDYEAAETLLLAAHAGLVDVYGASHARTIETVRTLTHLYEDWGRPAQADEWAARLTGAPSHDGDAETAAPAPDGD